MKEFDAEIARTAFQRKAVSKRPPAEVLALAASFFRERGYRTGPMGSGDKLFVMGPGEGALPRVTGDITARADVGKPGTTLVTLNGAGERLGAAMAEFYALLRARTPAPSKSATSDPAQ